MPLIGELYEAHILIAPGGGPSSGCLRHRKPSADADLSGITLSSGSLSPAFAAATTAYTANVANSETSVTVTGVKADASSSVSAPVTLSGLAVGVAQTATITVTAGDGTTTKSYTVAVTRAAATPAVSSWAATDTAGPSNSYFYATAADSSGNICAAGYIQTTGTFSFGNGVSVPGKYSGTNCVLVKYDSTGVAQWAKSLSTAPSDSLFTSLAVDSSGNIFAAGIMYGTTQYDFGNSKTASGKYSGYNAVVAKYDISGNAYAVGYVMGTGSYSLGNSVSFTAASANYNAILIKYNSSGAAQWASGTTADIEGSAFNAAALDSTGAIIAAGTVVGTTAHGFGPGVSIKGSLASNYNAALVKFDSSGAAQSGLSATTGSSISKFFSVSVDGSNDVYAAGYMSGSGAYAFTNGATAAGKYSGYNALLLRY